MLGGHGVEIGGVVVREEVGVVDELEQEGDVAGGHAGDAGEIALW